MIEFFDRTAYAVFAIDVPRLRGKELAAAVQFKLGALYPGDVSTRNVQIRKNGNKKWAYLAFVLPPDTGAAMLPLSTLFVRQTFARQSGNALYLGKRWFEYVRIENGVVLSSTVKVRDESQLVKDINEIRGTDSEMTVYCDSEDAPLLAPLQETVAVRLLDAQAGLKNASLHSIALFSEKSPAVKWRRALAAALALLALAGIGASVNRQRKNERERVEERRVEREHLEKANAERQREAARLAELAAQYQKLAAAKTASPYDIAAVIAECAGPQTRILSATFSSGFFQIEGSTGNSLDMLHAFERHPLAGNIRLHQVRPDKGRDAFTMSGTILPEMAVFDASLPVPQQIAALEEAIATETGYLAANASLTPSAFGEEGTALFSKRGCAVSGYQFMNEAGKTEIEYSVRGTGAGFFNALYDIKNSRRSWEVSLVQIRNLYPRDALDIVVRVRTVYRPADRAPQQGSPPETSSPFPVAAIARNFYTAPLPRLPPAAASPPENPPPAAPAGVERVSWLEYVGSISDDSGGRLVYLKNIRTGEIFKLGQTDDGDMRYRDSAAGGIIAYIGGHIYEINRR